MWRPLTGPHGTFPFTTYMPRVRPGLVHHTYQLNLPHHMYMSTPFHVSLPHHLYGRTVNCQMACTNCIVIIFLLFGKTDRMQYLPRMNSIWACSSYVGIVRTRSTHPHSEAFGPPKDYFQSIWRWGYISLTFPTSILLALLGCVPLKPTQRYSRFPHFEVFIFLSRIVSSCNSEIYYGEKSSMEEIWTFSPW